MYVSTTMVTVFVILFFAFGFACVMAGRAWGIDVGHNEAARVTVLEASPAAAIVKPVPAAPPGWADHAAPDGELMVPCSPEVERMQRRMAALTDETMAAFEQARADLRASLPPPAEPTAPQRIVR